MKGAVRCCVSCMFRDPDTPIDNEEDMKNFLATHWERRSPDGCLWLRGDTCGDKDLSLLIRVGRTSNSVRAVVAIRNPQSVTGAA